MDLRFKNLKCPCCDSNTMESAGGNFGVRVDLVKFRCTVCTLALLIIPMKKEYEYEIKATTADDRKKALIEKEKEKSELALAKKIIEIQNS